MIKPSAFRVVLGRAAALCVGFALVTGNAFAQSAWRDLSKHESQLVPVDRDVTLEVLDWGWAGPATVVLLTGSGHTAHVYDDFAPKLFDCCRVYGITRRGYGASSRPASGYDDQRLANDVVAVLQRLKLAHPVLIGHSMAGGEMTTLGRQHPDLVSGLVYLDALGDLEDDPPADPEWAALAQKMPPGVRPDPVCAPQDTSSFAAYRLTQACRRGYVVPLPEAELRQMFEVDGERVGRSRAPDWVSRAIGQGQVFRRDYSHIGVPVLALLELPALRPTDRRPPGEADRAIVDAFVARHQVLANRKIDKARRQIKDFRVVDLPGAGHYIFLTRESDVVREIHQFIEKLSKQ